MSPAATLAHRPTGETTIRANRLVADRRPRADRIGRDLAEHVNDPEGFAEALVAGLRELADPACEAGQRLVAPGIGALFGVRQPLLAAVERGFRAATKSDRPSALLFIADRAFRIPELEARWFAIGLLERTLAADPERTWQLLRRAARQADDWITVDTLARVVGRGILGESYRWAELEQVVFSASRWERRLVGSTIASLPFVDRRAGRTPQVAARGLELLGRLIGDAEPDVQKALSWAYRSLSIVDLDAVVVALEGEAGRAVMTGDGQRAWVIRHALANVPEPIAEDLRACLAGLRRRRRAGSTSEAAELVSRFGLTSDPSHLPEPPLT